MSEIIQHHHIQILDPEPSGAGGQLIQDDLVSLANYDVALNAAVAQKANSAHQHASADISDATYLPTPDTIAKRDAEGDLVVNRLDVASIYWGDETIVIDGQTIYAPTVSVTASHFVGSGQFLTDLPDHVHAIADTTGLQTALDGKAALAGATFTGQVRAPYLSSTNSTAKWQDGYNGGMDEVFVNGGIFRTTEMNQTGTNDIFFQLYPVAATGYGIIESWTSAGLILGTGNNDNPIILRTNRVERARVTSSGLSLSSSTASAPAVVYLRTSTHDTANSIYSITWRNDLDNADVGIVKLSNPSANSFTMTLGTYQHLSTLSLSGGHCTLEGDLIGSGFWNIKAGAAGDGRLDIRAGTLNVFGSLNPQSSMFMGLYSGNDSHSFGLTGKTGGNYRSIYYKYSNADLIYLSQWADGSWDHEMGRWNDHGDLTVVGTVRAAGYMVGEYQVVGVRQPSVDDASEDLASVKTQLNLALAALRAHGLIQSPA